MDKGPVLLISNYSNKTGYAWNNIHRLFNEIALHFDALGCNVHISFAEIIPPVTNFSSSLSLTLHQYNVKDVSLTNTLRLIKLLRKYKIQYLYLTDQRVVDYRYILIRKFTNVKKIVIHSRVSVPDPSPAGYEKGIKGLIKAMLGRWNLVCADRTYAVSEFVRSRLLLKNRLPPCRVVKILNGIDVNKFSRLPGDDTRNSSGTIRIFAGSRASRYKGIHVLIKSADCLKKRLSNRFLIRYAGDGPDIDFFRDLVFSLKLQDQFLFLGELTSTESEVKNADIIVVPSIWGDACPSSVLEALASGTPLIATSVGGVPEIVGDAKNARLIKPDSVEELTLALEELISSSELRKEIGRRGHIRAKEALQETDYHKRVVEQLQYDFSIDGWQY